MECQSATMHGVDFMRWSITLAVLTSTSTGNMQDESGTIFGWFLGRFFFFFWGGGLRWVKSDQEIWVQKWKISTKHYARECMNTIESRLPKTVAYHYQSKKYISFPEAPHQKCFFLSFRVTNLFMHHWKVITWKMRFLDSRGRLVGHPSFKNGNKTKPTFHLANDSWMNVDLAQDGPNCKLFFF